MANTIRGLQASTNGRNTGFAGIKLMPGIIKGDILVPHNWSVAVAPGDSDATIVAAVIASLQAAMINNNYSSRAQFLGKYISFEDKSEAATMQQFNYGSKKKVNEGKYIYEYTYDNGGLDYHTAVRSFDGKEDQYKVVRVDAAGVLYGTNQYDNTGSLIGIQGLELDNLNVYPMKAATFTTEAEYRVGLTFSKASELNENLFALATGVNMFDIITANTVVDLVVVPFAQTATRVSPVMVKTKSGNLNVADTLGTLLNDPTAFVITNATSGVAIAITSVALNPLTKKYVITMTAGAGYVAGQTALISLGSVSALTALLASYYDGSTIATITMT